MTANPISINSDAMQAIVHKAILEGIDDQQRDTLIAQAVQFLITAPKSDGYSRYQSPSPLQSAFNEAVTRATYAIVAELVDQGDLADQIRVKVNQAVTEYLSSTAEVADGIGSAIGEAIGTYLKGNR